MLSVAARRTVARSQVRAFAVASPWGDSKWRHEQDAFKGWTIAAMKDNKSIEARQLYGFLINFWGC